MKFSIDNGGSLILDSPGLLGGAEVTASHADGLGQAPGQYTQFRWPETVNWPVYTI